MPDGLETRSGSTPVAVSTPPSNVPFQPDSTLNPIPVVQTLDNQQSSILPESTRVSEEFDPQPHVSNNIQVPLQPSEPSLNNIQNSTPSSSKNPHIPKKELSKLPMPPGINQKDLENIESPQVSPVAQSPKKKVAIKKTNNRASILDLPMPSGNISFQPVFKMFIVY